MVTCSNKVYLGFSIAGLGLIIVGAVLGFAVAPVIIEDQIHKNVEIREGTEQFDRFVELPITVELKVYVFNIINPEEVTFNGSKPIVEEVGPYVYKQSRKKENVTYDEIDDTWTYVEYQHYEFDAEASYPLTENDILTVLNVGLNAFFQIAANILSPSLLDVLLAGVWQEIFPNTSTMFHEVRVGDLLFDGYRFCDPEGMSFVPRLLCLIVGLLNIKFLERQEDSSIKFSFLAFKNNHHDGILSVDAGMNSIKSLGLIRQWNGDAYTNIWKDRMSHCNKVSGRDGTVFPPGMGTEVEVDIFLSDICRKVRAKYSEETDVLGITGHKRVIADGAMSSPDNNPDNACYCTDGIQDLYGEFRCLPDGFVSAEPCIGVAAIASLPHFMDADPEYANTVEGLQPDANIHSTFAVIEPVSVFIEKNQIILHIFQTGVPLEGRKRVQFNMILRPIQGLMLTENLAHSMTPIIWVEEGVMLTEELADELKSRFFTPLLIVEIFKWLLIGIGILLFVGCGGVYIYKARRAAKNK